MIDPIDDLESLAGLAFTSDALDIVRDGYVRLPEQPGTAVLARPALLEDIARGLADNPHEARYWDERDDPRAASLEILLNHLRTLPPAQRNPVRHSDVICLPRADPAGAVRDRGAHRCRGRLRVDRSLTVLSRLQAEGADAGVTHPMPDRDTLH